MKVKSLASHSSLLKAYCVVQMVVALFLIVFTFIQWFASQVGVQRMTLAGPLVIFPLEGAAIFLAFFTLSTPRREYFGVWAMLGLFRIIISFYLPLYMWVYVEPWPPPPLAPIVPVITHAELFFGAMTLIWVWFIRPTFG